jgi:hypothetical protein
MLETVSTVPNQNHLNLPSRFTLSETVAHIGRLFRPQVREFRNCLRFEFGPSYLTTFLGHVGKRSMMKHPLLDDRCIGTLPRRALLRLGVVGLGGLTLPDLLQLESALGAENSKPTGKSLIVLWLWGGPSHMETFDLKPDAPLEYRGEFRPIPTTAKGLSISEYLPLLAAQGDKLAIIRSLHHDSPGHVNSTHTMLTGYPGNVAEMPPFRPDYPDLWAVTSKTCGERVPGVPIHVALPRIRYNGAAHLGSSLEPFVVAADPNAKDFAVPNLALNDRDARRLSSRRDLATQFDHFRRAFDASGTMDSLDQFNQRAATLLTSGAVKTAFDLKQETAETRDRYGRHEVGQRCLLARRLVEAGVRIVTIDFPCVPGQKAFSWDDHASVWNIFEQMKIRLPVLDQVSSALIEDIHARGLNQEVLVLVMGEMSHTPRLSNHEGQPGREHWGRSMSVLLSGGGMRMGQAIGSTTPNGDEPFERPLTPNDLLATLYSYFGVPLKTHFDDRFGRPTAILPHGEPISELI